MSQVPFLEFVTTGEKITPCRSKKKKWISSKLGAENACNKFKPPAQAFHDLWWGSDSSFPVVEFRALFPALSKVREETGSDLWVRHWSLAQWGSSFKSFGRQVVMQLCSSYSMFGDICSTTATALFSCSFFLHSSTYREKFVFSSVVFMKVIWRWDLLKTNKK